MSVLQIIKDLVGEEDLSWGDSDTTFTRQTHTGGSTSIHYIDSKSIPANTLGSYVDDYLHAQNTDTGTTQTTFVINSGGNAATLSTTGLTGSGTYTFPTSAGQALTGAVDLASVSTNLGASLVGVEDSGEHFSAANVETILAELATDVEAIATYRGYKRGFELGYLSTTAITIGGGMWDHRGTTNQAVYTTSQISFTLGSGGSNSNSTNLGANEVHYIYIDDSAVVSAGSALLTASEFLNTTSAPSYDHSKAGWYNGSDRCVGAILTDGSNNILQFLVCSDSLFIYEGTLPIERSSAVAPTSAEEIDMSSSIPKFATRARVKVLATDDGVSFAWATGAELSPNAYILTGTSNDANYIFDACLDSGQSAWLTASSAVTITVYVVGFYIDAL